MVVTVIVDLSCREREIWEGYGESWGSYEERVGRVMERDGGVINVFVHLVCRGMRRGKCLYY